MPPRDYTDISRDQLIALLEDALAKKPFGLRWERDPAALGPDDGVNDDFVALDFQKELSHGDGPHRHLLIEGENLDALRHLRMTHAGRIKCILIDPPYNTGKKDFIYNDRFIDETHRYRHSVWLEFMHRRLTLARDLLTPDGVIFICIGEEEVHRLGCLMDEVMPGRKVGTFVWKTRSGANDSRDYFRSTDHEYILAYANPGFTFGGQVKSVDAYHRDDHDGKGPWCDDNLVKAHNWLQRPAAFYSVYNPTTDILYPCDPDSVWRFATASRAEGKKLRSDTMEEQVKNNKIMWPGNTATARYETRAALDAALADGTAPDNLLKLHRALTASPPEKLAEIRTKIAPEDLDFSRWVGRTIGLGKPRYKRHFKELKRTEKPFSTWIRYKADKEQADEDTHSLCVSGTGEGTTLLKDMLGNKDFAYPKPLSLIQGLIAQSTGPDDTVLDFFAGSATTGHAVLALNQADGDEGNRRFILVCATESSKENPERNVCRDVSRPRLLKAISGYTPAGRGAKPVAGIGGDFAYLRLARIPTGRLTRLAHTQVWNALQLIHLDTLDAEPPASPVWMAGDAEHRLVYLPATDIATLDALRTAHATASDMTVYSWSPDRVRSHLPARAIVRPIPQYLAEAFGVRA